MWGKRWPPVFGVHLFPVSLGVNVGPGRELLFHPNEMGVVKKLRHRSFDRSDVGNGVFAVTLLAYMDEKR